jgi:apolipoprotein D and lipocalin family protein
MYRMILLFLALAACSERTGPDPVMPSFRAPDAPIYSSAVVDRTRLFGTWVQVATFAKAEQAICSAGQVEFVGDDVRWDLCLADGRRRGAGPLTAGKAGRFSVEGMADWWVLWVDADYRTLVIGTPSGGFGLVLNRQATLPLDRSRAVRDILEFNGYQTEDLVFLSDARS